MKQIEVGRQISVQPALAGQPESVENGPFNVNLPDVVKDHVAIVVVLHGRRGRRRGRMRRKSRRRGESCKVRIGRRRIRPRGLRRE